MKFTKNTFFTKTQLIILCILAACAFAAKFFVAFHPSNVIPRDDGLYYLFLSENLRLVYPDHTPMIAYFLAFARFVFNLLVPGTFEDYLPGSLALVPISSTIYFLFLYAFIYFFVAHVWKNKPLAILLVFTFLLTPYLWGISFLTTPETPLTFFAFPAVLLFAHAFLKQPENLKVWLLAGFFLAGAFLGKILAIPLGISIALYAIISPKRKLYLTNYRFYLAFTPAIIAGLVVLYADYLDNFSMIKYLFKRTERLSNFHTISTFFSNQFVYYTPLFYLLLLFLPSLNVYTYTRKYLPSIFFKKNRLPASSTNNTFSPNILEEKQKHFYEELLFFLAVLSILCMAFLYYQVLNTFLLNWWGGFTVAPNLLFMCVWVYKKIFSSKNKVLRNLVFANLVLAGIYCPLASFQSIYGNLEVGYSPFKYNPKDKFPTYNLVINRIGKFMHVNFGSYPKDTAGWLHAYYPLSSEFKHYYEKYMDKKVPIIGINFGVTVFIHFYVRPEIPVKGLTVNNAPFELENSSFSPNVDFYSIFDSLFSLKDIKTEKFYLVSLRGEGTFSKYRERREILSRPPHFCKSQKTFTASRVGKPIMHHTLYLCKTRH